MYTLRVEGIKEIFGYIFSVRIRNKVYLSLKENKCKKNISGSIKINMGSIMRIDKVKKKHFRKQVHKLHTLVNLKVCKIVCKTKGIT